MKVSGLAKAVFALALVGLAAGAFGASAGLARPKPPPPIIYPPPPPPPPPPVGMSARLVDDAAAFAAYMRRSAAISPAFADPQGVSSALRVAVAYEPAQLRRGGVIYAAIAALGAREFVEAVRAAGQTPEDRYALQREFYANPRNVLRFAGAAQAEGLAKAALAAAGERLMNDGAVVRQAAYEVQHQTWSLADVPNPDQRAADVKSLSSSPRAASEEDVAALDRQISGDAPDPPAAFAAPPYDAMIVRAVALAGLAAVGEAEDSTSLGWLSDDYFLAHCLGEAKLALYECLAVAKPNYEDVFCLGQHAMRDTGECIVRSSGVGVPLVVVTPPLAIPPVHHHAAKRRRHA